MNTTLETPTPNTVSVCLWNRKGTTLWYWDNAEYHSDQSLSPVGPFASERDAKRDIRESFPRKAIEYIIEIPEWYFRGTDEETDTIYGDGGNPPEPIYRYRVNVYGGSGYVTLFTVTREESGVRFVFNAIYPTLDDAKDAVDSDIDTNANGDIGQFTVSSYIIDEQPLIVAGHVVTEAVMLKPHGKTEKH